MLQAADMKTPDAGIWKHPKTQQAPNDPNDPKQPAGVYEKHHDI